MAPRKDAMPRANRSYRKTGAPALKDYCEQMRFRVLARARFVAEKTARREAQQIAQLKSNFISMMSHELRTPLNSIIGFSEILARPSTFVSDCDRVNYAQLINSSGKHLTSVVNGILEMSKIQSGTYEVALVDTNLIDVVEEVVATMDVVAHKAGVRLERRWEAGRITAPVDDTRLIQSVRNIVDNAIKFTEAGGTVAVDCRRGEAATATITVADTGTGMDELELEQALTPFGQAGRSLNSDFGGTGLGLCIARELTQLQKGRFSIRSTKGKGTVVTFEFPMNHTHSIDADRPSVPRAANGEMLTLRSAVSAHVGH
jgi:signal transduction histidine kinase